jgi:hypothetical protein
MGTAVTTAGPMKKTNIPVVNFCMLAQKPKIIMLVNISASAMLHSVLHQERRSAIKRMSGFPASQMRCRAWQSLLHRRPHSPKGLRDRRRIVALEADVRGHLHVARRILPRRLAEHACSTYR